MIKGICKEAVIVKCGGKVIDEAIFILKNGAKKTDRKAILDEANAIIREKTSLARKSDSKRRNKFMKAINDEKY